MTLIKTIGLGAGALVLALAGLAHAEAATAAKGPGARAGGQRPLAQVLRGRVEKLKELKAELNLSPDQKEKIKVILKDHKEEISTAVKTVMEKRKALHDAVTAATPDEAAIRTAATDLGKAIADAAVTRSKIHSEIAKVLTPEQIEKLKKLRAEHEKAADGAVGGGLEELGKEL